MRRSRAAGKSSAGPSCSLVPDIQIMHDQVQQRFAQNLFMLAQLDLSEMIIAVDFDGTCVTHEFPLIGWNVPGAVEVLKALNAAGATLIVWTIRSDQPTVSGDPHEAERAAKHSSTDFLSQAVEWFNDHDIRLTYVNNNLQQKKWSSSPKAYAHLYIDDAALGCPLVHGAHNRPYVDWHEVAARLVERFSVRRDHR